MKKSADLAVPSDDESDTYDPVFFNALAAIEDRHFWFNTRNKVIDVLLRQLVKGLKPGYRVLELGCGNGNVLKVLDQACPEGFVLGTDLFIEGLMFASGRTSRPLLQADLLSLPFSIKFDVICLFDVVEHLPEDVKVLEYLHGFLKPGGVLFLTVPAHPALWSYFDDASHHCRRYRIVELEEKLIKAGYNLEYTTQYMVGIYPVVWLSRRLRSLSIHRHQPQRSQAIELTKSELTINPFLNGLFLGILKFELPFIANRKKLPFGTSILTLASKM
jgi:SAM-dependent methyltransferase